MRPPVTAPPTLTDSHCHLDFDGLREDLPGVLARAAAAGVRRVVTICTRPHDAGPVRAISEAHAPVFWAVGTHPMQVASEPEASLDHLTGLAAHPKMVAIGETGLDYHYTRDSAAAQQEALRTHIEAARRTGLPLVIHARDADEDMARILTEEHRAGAYDCVMHCFSSGPALAEAALGLGFTLSMSGIAAFPRSEALRAIFAAAPRDRIIVETDSPYLAPPPHRGRPNEPAFVAHTAAAGAAALGLDLEAFAALTEANFDRVFHKAAAWTSGAEGSADGPRTGGPAAPIHGSAPT